MKGMHIPRICPLPVHGQLVNCSLLTMITSTMLEAQVHGANSGGGKYAILCVCTMSSVFKIGVDEPEPSSNLGTSGGLSIGEPQQGGVGTFVLRKPLRCLSRSFLPGQSAHIVYPHIEFAHHLSESAEADFSQMV